MAGQPTVAIGGSSSLLLLMRAIPVGRAPSGFWPWLLYGRQLGFQQRLGYLVLVLQKQTATHAACEYYRLRELRKNCQRTPEELAADAAGDKHDSSLVWLKVNKLRMHTNRPSNTLVIER